MTDKDLGYGFNWIPSALTVIQDILNGPATHLAVAGVASGAGHKRDVKRALGKIQAWEWRKVEAEERVDVAEDIDLSFSVNSVEVMESELKRGGPVYTILESCQLN